jgi:hypothetical protein
MLNGRRVVEAPCQIWIVAFGLHSTDEYSTAIFAVSMQRDVERADWGVSSIQVSLQSKALFLNWLGLAIHAAIERSGDPRTSCILVIVSDVRIRSRIRTYLRTQDRFSI